MTGERDRLRERLRGQRDRCGGTLRIGVMGSTVPLLKTLILPFSERFLGANLHVMLQSTDSPIFGKAESEILAQILAKTPHIVTNAIWLVIDHARTGKWASVLPRPVRGMASDDPGLESIPVPNIGKASSVAIAISKRELASPLAQAFFGRDQKRHRRGCEPLWESRGRIGRLAIGRNYLLRVELECSSRAVAGLVISATSFRRSGLISAMCKSSTNGFLAQV